MSTFTTHKKEPSDKAKAGGGPTSTSNKTFAYEYPKLRILVLHGGSHNSAIFKNQLTPLLNFFGNQSLLDIDFVFLDSPLLIDPSSKKGDPKHNLRHWFQEDSSNCLGIDASLLWILQSLELEMNSNPFHGVFGFSQGGTIAGLLPLLKAKSQAFADLKFVILANAYVIKDKDKRIKGLLTLDPSDHVEEGVVHIPSLHIIGEDNKVVRPEESMELLGRFTQPQLHLHPHGHCIPQAKNDFETIGRFLLKRAEELKAVLGGADFKMIQETQNRLLMLEVEAREMVRESTMEGVDGKPPPRALMAVIDKDSVGGWSGNRKETPLRGAPCPGEFVKSRAERNGNVEGGRMTREKPETSKK